MTSILFYSIFPVMACRKKIKRRSYKKESYFKYLKSAHWKAIKKLALQMYKSCVLCNSKKKLNVHHRNYDHLYNEIITEDLIVLCKDCHCLYHGIEKPKVKKPKFKNEYNKYSLGAQIMEAYRTKQKERRN